VTIANTWQHYNKGKIYYKDDYLRNKLKGFLKRDIIDPSAVFDEEHGTGVLGF
jgi:hypothetical protein